MHLQCTKCMHGFTIVHCYMHVFHFSVCAIAERVELGVSSFGVSITTMEEVFIKVGLGEDATLQSK